MTDWKDPTVIQRASRVFSACGLFLAGMASWEVLRTLWFDWQVFTGKRKFKWPMLLYFGARAVMLLFVFSSAVSQNTLGPVPCTAFTAIGKACDSIGIWLSSAILILRTRAVWQMNTIVTIVMGLLYCGQIAVWCLMFRDTESVYDARRMGCIPTKTPASIMMASVWGYTMAFDLIILVLCAYRLYRPPLSTLSNLLLRDGIIYFCATFLANLVQTILAALNLNPVMNVVGLQFCLVISVIAATTLFRNVFTMYDTFSYPSFELDLSTGPQSASAFGGPGRSTSDDPTLRMPHQTSRVLFAHSKVEDGGGISLNDYGTKAGRHGYLGPVAGPTVVDIETERDLQTQRIHSAYT